MVELTDSNFNEFINSRKIAVVDLGASWCHPCQTLKNELKDKADDMFGYADIEVCTDMVYDYNIRSVPTVLIFRDGELVVRKVGSITYSAIAKAVKDLS